MIMDRLSIQRELYKARDAYLKAKKDVEFWEREIAILKDLEKALDRPSLVEEMFQSIR